MIISIKYKILIWLIDLVFMTSLVMSCILIALSTNKIDAIFYSLIMCLCILVLIFNEN